MHSFDTNGKRTLHRLIKKLTAFFLIISSLILVVLFLSAQDCLRRPIAVFFGCEDYITVNNGPDEIKGWLEKVSEKNNCSKLILGDSVCCQMFSGLQWCNDDICIAGTNGAVTMAGQYILLTKFLENHEKVTDVWLVVLPNSLQVYVNKYVGYQYVVMPFVESDTFKLLDNNTQCAIANSFGRYALNPKFVSFLDKSVLARKIYLNYIMNNYREPDEEWPISSIATNYLGKMKKLCDEKGAKLHLLPAPLPDNQQSVEFVDLFKAEFINSEIGRLFPEYLDVISFYPAEQFVDGAHFGGEYAEQDAYNEKILEMYSCDELVNYLKFE